MEREKMIDRWEKEFEQDYCSWYLHPQIYDYFDEEAGQPFPDDYTPPKNHKSYSSWIVDELDGENHELAVRMLITISQLREEGLLYAHNIQNEVPVCIRMGYPFETIFPEILKQFETESYFAKLPKTLFKIAGDLVNGYPAEAKKYVDTHLTNEVPPLDTEDNNYPFYLLCYMALRITLSTPKANTEYLPILIEAVKKHPAQPMLLLAWYGRQLSAGFGKVLAEQLESKVSTSKYLLEQIKPAELLQLIEETGASRWSYYYPVLTAEFKTSGKNYGAMFQKLYKEDKVTLIQLYEKIAQSQERHIFIESGYLLALLLQGGENKKYADQYEPLLKAIFDTMFEEYSSQEDIPVEQYTDLTIPLAEIEYSLSFKDLFYGPKSKEAIQVAALLYDYLPGAQRFFYMMNHAHQINRSKDTLGRNFIEARKTWLNIDPQESLEILFETGYTLSEAFLTYTQSVPGSYMYRNSGGREFLEAMQHPVIYKNRHLIVDLLKDETIASEDILVLLDLLYTGFNYPDGGPLIDLLSHKSKAVRKKAAKQIDTREQSLRPLLEEQLPTLKSDPKATAKRIIKKWNNEQKYGSGLTFTNNQMVIEFCKDNYDKDYTKYISWIPGEMLIDVRFADLSGKAPAVVLQYILSEYLSLEEPYVLTACDKVAEQLHTTDLEAMLENIYEFWKEGGADAKRKMFMVPYCLYASGIQILNLRSDLREWSGSSRGALATFVVKAIGLSPKRTALVMLDDLAIKFSSGQVRNAAKAAFSAVAETLGIPEDELSDQIVPTLGFNKAGEKTVDYGTRTFTVTLKPDLTLTVYDNDKQKSMRSLPAPNKHDDKTKAEAARKEFTELKKEIKLTQQIQSNRLKQVLTNGRRWNPEGWKNLFVENPIMRHFATGLIWGIYEEDILTQTFRYMEDGTFNTADETEYLLPPNASISLVHPAELSQEILRQWEKQLDEYEIRQPIPQLTLPFIQLSHTDIEDNKIIRYKDKQVLFDKMTLMAYKNNLHRGEIKEEGKIHTFHWIYRNNIAALITYEQIWNGNQYNKNVIVGELQFYLLEEDKLPQDQPQELINPATVPVRFINHIVRILDPLIIS